jgi:hypothetical protein
VKKYFLLMTLILAAKSRELFGLESLVAERLDVISSVKTDRAQLQSLLNSQLVAAKSLDEVRAAGERLLKYETSIVMSLKIGE